MKLAGVAAIATVLVCGAVACSSEDAASAPPSTVTVTAAPETQASTSAVVTSATYPPRTAVHEDEFVAAMIKGDGRFLTVNPLGQADQICGKLDAGVDVKTVVDSVLRTLQTKYADQSPYEMLGWDEFDAEFLTGQAAINVCPAHEAAFRATYE